MNKWKEFWTNRFTKFLDKILPYEKLNNYVNIGHSIQICKNVTDELKIQCVNENLDYEEIKNEYVSDFNVETFRENIKLKINAGIVVSYLDWIPLLKYKYLTWDIIDSFCDTFIEFSQMDEYSYASLIECVILLLSNDMECHKNEFTKN